MVSRRTQSQVAEVNASSITSGSITYQPGDTVLVYVFKDSGSAVSMADSVTGGLGFWDLLADNSSVSLYACCRSWIASNTSATLTYTNSGTAHLSMAILVYTAVNQIRKQVNPSLLEGLLLPTPGTGYWALVDYTKAIRGWAFHSDTIAVFCCVLNGGNPTAAPSQTFSGPVNVFTQNGTVKWSLDEWGVGVKNPGGLAGITYSTSSTSLVNAFFAWTELTSSTYPGDLTDHPF